MAHGQEKARNWTGEMMYSGSNFSFEDLEVWKKTVDYAGVVIALAEKIGADRKHYRLLEQLESSAASIAANIAEGKGRYSRKSSYNSFILHTVLCTHP